MGAIGNTGKSIARFRGDGQANDFAIGCVERDQQGECVMDAGAGVD